MKNVLITGASGNLGKATVEKFATDGFHIIATVSPGKGLGFEVPANVETVEADLTNEEMVSNVIAAVIERHQTIDAALLLVGGFASGSIDKADGAAVKKMFALNFETAYYTARSLFAHMLTQSAGGRIVMVGSRPSLNASEGKNLVAYGLSKTLIFKLAEYINAAGAGKNVTATVVVPSTIDTPANRASMPKANPADWVRPEEIADLMAFICSQEAKALRESVFKVYGNS